jgi:hypothetical protein
MKIRYLTISALFSFLVVGACGPNGPPPPSCLPGGSACQSSAYCCSGNCSNGVCRGGGSCLGVGIACVNGAQCCSGFCTNGGCTCLANGYGCGQDNDCCSGNCNRNAVCAP